MGNNTKFHVGINTYVDIDSDLRDVVERMPVARSNIHRQAKSLASS